ncbi:hypothetical protein WME89_05875 [Sorangium sp. So ce321]|uniref:hypothetical protein n=1 Tax=Sorangium sp. So ce321 TaxID=3133300 RepID=UPI003F5F901F
MTSFASTVPRLGGGKPLFRRNDWFNNTSFNNGTQSNMLASRWDANDNRTNGVTLTGDKVHRMHNNISFPLKNTD